MTSLITPGSTSDEVWTYNPKFPAQIFNRQLLLHYFLMPLFSLPYSVLSSVLNKSGYCPIVKLSKLLWTSIKVWILFWKVEINPQEDVFKKDFHPKWLHLLQGQTLWSSMWFIVSSMLSLWLWGSYLQPLSYQPRYLQTAVHYLCSHKSMAFLRTLCSSHFSFTTVS